MPVRRTVITRTLVSLAAVAGLGAAFVVGASYGGSGGPDAAVGGSHRVGTDASPAAYTGSDLTLPDSCADLLHWYVDKGVDLVGPYGWGGNPNVIYDFAEESAGGPAPLAGTAAGDAVKAPSAAAPAPVRATNEGSGTNVQEAGVDEPDVVKTDGRTLFRVQDGDLVSYDLSGATVQRLGSLDLPGTLSGGTTELLVSGDIVVAVSHRDDDGSRRPETHVVTVDVSDPADPRVTHTVDYDSGLVTARLQDGVVRVVLRAALPELDFRMPDDHTTEYEATAANRALVEDTTIEDWLPSTSLDGGEAQPLVGCDQVALPDDASTLGTIAVVGFDAAAPQAPSVTGLAVDTDLAYASLDQLYLATSPTYGGVVRGCEECIEPLPSPQPVDPEPGGLLPGWLTGHGRGSYVPAPRPYDGASHLYAFDLDGIDTRFAASGEVDGVIRDRWSMDAVDGTLRVAVGPNGSTGDFSSIVTFRQAGNDLVVSGRLDDLGVGEDIQSVRWFDTLAIVVTFREVDPLYAIDLTDADHPRLMGSLKIPGYSAYLHPLGQHRLLGLGQAPDRNGSWGAQAGLFNVTDLTHPVRLDTVQYAAGSQAMAATDPRQLTWLPDGRTVLTVVADYGTRGDVGYVSVLTLGEGHLANRMVEVEYGDEIADVRLVPLPDGRVVLVTGDDASFMQL